MFVYKDKSFKKITEIINKKADKVYSIIKKNNEYIIYYTIQNDTTKTSTNDTELFYEPSYFESDITIHKNKIVIKEVSSNYVLPENGFCIGKTGEYFKRLFIIDRYDKNFVLIIEYNKGNALNNIDIYIEFNNKKYNLKKPFYDNNSDIYGSGVLKKLENYDDKSIIYFTSGTVPLMKIMLEFFFNNDAVLKKIMVFSEYKYLRKDKEAVI